MSEDVQAHEAAAVAAARQAGQLLRQRLGAATVIETKGNPADLVTEVDRQAEAMIVAALTGAFPATPVLGEEGVAGRPDAGAGDLWVVDPLDGTTNFVHGIPVVAVSIALVSQGQRRVGVVYDPLRDELFTARAGAGAFLNGQAIRVAAESSLERALIATGNAPDPECRRLNLAGMLAVSQRVRNLRNLGSAALHLAYVAAGRVTGFWQIGLKPWDLAAGALLVEEAGGRVSDTAGRPYTLETANIVAGGVAIHTALLDLLQAAGASGEPCPEARPATWQDRAPGRNSGGK